MAGDILIDGLPASAEDLAHQALVNYGALTSFRVEDGAARGLDLHLQRLTRSAEILFGQASVEADLRDLMRRAVEGREDCWLRVSLFSPEIGPRTPSWRGRPKVMTAVFPPPPPLAKSVKLTVQTYVRETPGLKHVATFGLIQARRRAREAGFDDALFADRDGRVSEGSLWNIGFIEGERIVWPEAPMLGGVAQALIRAGLAEAAIEQDTRPIRVEDLTNFDGAFICNSATPACPVTAIDGAAYAVDAATMGAVAAAWEAAPLQAI